VFFSASPEYLVRKGRPASLVDLRHHDLIWVEDEGGPHRGWGLDEVRRVGGVPRLSVSHVDAAIAAAVDGLGVLRTLSYQVAGEIEAGRLVPLLRDDEAPALPVSLLFEAGQMRQLDITHFPLILSREFRRKGNGLHPGLRVAEKSPPLLEPSGD